MIFSNPLNLAVVIKDFNRDGVEDLATFNNIASSISIFLGNGDGTFNQPLFYATQIAK
jgi:hypothetical protein